MPRKRNASGAGSIRQRSDGRWEARITVGTDPGTGKPVRRSIYGNTQKEVLVAMRDAQKSVDDGLYIEPRANAPDTRAMVGHLAARLSSVAEVRHGKDLPSTNRDAHQARPRRCEAEQTHAPSCPEFL